MDKRLSRRVATPESLVRIRVVSYNGVVAESGNASPLQGEDQGFESPRLHKMKVYRIKNREGKFSCGGHRPYFTNKGKIWKKLGHVRIHLHGVGDEATNIYKDCVLETYEITEVLIDAEPVMPIILDYLAGREIQKETMKIQSQRRKYLEEKKRYEELKERFA